MGSVTPKRRDQFQSGTRHLRVIVMSVRWPCRGSGKYAPTRQQIEAISISRQSVWDLWWK